MGEGSLIAFMLEFLGSRHAYCEPEGYCGEPERPWPVGMPSKASQVLKLGPSSIEG